MAGLELPVFAAFGTEGFDELAFAVELEDAAAAVTVGNKNVTVGRNGDGSGTAPGVAFRLLVAFDGHNNFAFEVELDDFSHHGAVDILGTVFR